MSSEKKYSKSTVWKNLTFLKKTFVFVFAYYAKPTSGKYCFA